MNDIEKEILFKSIDNFPKFFETISRKQDIKLKDKVEIKFKKGEHDYVEILIDNKEYKIDSYSFENIIKEIKAEKTNSDKQELINQAKLTEEKLRNDIFQVGVITYKVHKEYIENMLYTSDIASVHGVYLRKLKSLLNIFKTNNILQIENREIKSKKELLDYLKNIGFESVERDAEF